MTPQKIHELPYNGIVSVDFDKREITLRLGDVAFRELREDGFRIHHLASDVPTGLSQNEIRRGLMALANRTRWLYQQVTRLNKLLPTEEFANGKSEDNE